MPAKNRIKQYLENGYYHIYNRGVEKRDIFLEEQDYDVLLSYLKAYLLPKDDNKLRNRLGDPNLSSKEREQILGLIRLNNFADKINLLAYCLMPNHFHFLIKQNNLDAIDKFMNSLGTRYTMYFNRKYRRVGSLYQGVYKAVLITTDEQLLQLNRYIHQQALVFKKKKLKNWGEKPSSYREYLGLRKTEWVHPEEILNYFSKTNPSLSYESFLNEANNMELIQELIIEKY